MPVSVHSMPKIEMWTDCPHCENSAVENQLRETPEKSDRQIAAGLGVSQTTVGTQRKSMEEIGQLSKLDSSIGLDGKERPRQVQRKPVSVFNPSRQ